MNVLDPDAVALHTSRGYETNHSKFLMRLSVIASDLLSKPDICFCQCPAFKQCSAYDWFTLIDVACCSLLSGGFALSEGLCWSQVTATAAMVAPDGTASTSSPAHRPWPLPV